MRQTSEGYFYSTVEQARREYARKKKKKPTENPIHIARKYLEEHQDGLGLTYSSIGKKFGVSRAEVCYHIALVKRLPAEFVTWLEQCDDPKPLRVLTERRLRPVTKLKETDQQLRAIEALPFSPDKIPSTISPVKCTSRSI